jgi:ABC-type glycerol-3-phosphate transport system substrate-binding protein
VNKQKNLLVAGFMILLLVFVAACSSSEETGKSSNGEGATEEKKDPVSLRILHGYTGEQPQAPVFEPALEEFDANHPDIDLTIEASAGNSIREKLLADMAANSEPEVFVHWGIRRVENYINNNKIADLSEMIEQDSDMTDRFVEGAYNAVEYHGGVYGLPLSNYQYYLVINKELFEEHGVEVPTTYDELVTAVNQFTEAGLIPFAANNHSARYMMLTWLAQKTTLDGLIANTTAEEPFGDELLQAADKAAELERLGAFPEGKETLSTLQSLELFNSERSPMFYQHSWTIGSIAPELMDKVEVIPFPLGDSESEHTLISGTGFFAFMSQKAYEDPEKREAAWTLLKELTGPEIGRGFIEVAGNTTPVIVDHNPEKASKVMNQVLEMGANSEKIIPSMDEQLTSQEVADNYWNLTDQLSLQEITPEEYVEQLNQMIKEHPNTQYQ